MKKRIMEHLTSHPSYLKWGVGRLAAKYKCSPRTVQSILKTMSEAKQSYLTSLKD